MALVETDVRYFAPYDREGVWTGAAAGAAMGALGGLAMVLIPMFRTFAVNEGAFTPLRLIGAIGPSRPLPETAGLVVLGLFLHLMVSVTWGALFGALANRQGQTGGSIGFGIAYAFLVYTVMTWFLLPIVNPMFFRAATQELALTWFLGHLVYGLAVGFGPMFAVPVRRRWLAFRIRRARGEPTEVMF